MRKEIWKLLHKWAAQADAYDAQIREKPKKPDDVICALNSRSFELGNCTLELLKLLNKVTEQ